ncbi:hypothetical protein PoB_001716600 [Plakobranchus ocellatus]|uniref:Uncharacterized protein n=1 Tax=Plakobranchus ocellatus TaxID=259542 RepID=A0AAV3Z471_9GAST|nr:hypothetical protein PoB_001716600 [Plakobranchus ocellatus]
MQMDPAPVKEQSGLHIQWRDLMARHSALSRAESGRKRRTTRRKRKRISKKIPAPVCQAALSATKFMYLSGANRRIRSSPSQAIF